LLPDGAELSVEVTSLVALAHPGLLAQRIVFRAGEQPLDLDVTAWLAPSATRERDYADPRAGGSLQENLFWIDQWIDDDTMGAAQQAVNDTVVCAVALDTEPGIAAQWREEHHAVGRRIRTRLDSGGECELARYAVYGRNGSRRDVSAEALAHRRAGFDALQAEQVGEWARFWADADIRVPGQDALQQGLRFSAFNLRQSAGRDGRHSVPAKGLSGPGYDGHYFWDAEIYALPPLAFHDPEAARGLLRYRIATLEQARQRARELSHGQGALYPWRTISGRECSAFFPASTAQYHINAAIAYAVQLYELATGDHAFVREEAAEMLMETARIWIDLGHFNPEQDYRFTIHEVTGPDEYTAMVDNNYYTNLLAAEHLAYAVEVAGELAEHEPERWEALKRRIKLSAEEVRLWGEAAERIYLPYHPELGISLQDDSFFRKPLWNFDRFPEDDRPLLMKYHPLVLYRYQVLKQADVLLAHYLFPGDSDRLQKRRDFDYYEPLTTHDSSLSPLVHSVIAFRIGRLDKALEYFAIAARADLDNLHGNTRHGVHIASMGGAISCIRKGLAGLEFTQGHLALQPLLPAGWDSYGFSLRYRGRRLGVEVDGRCTVTLLEGEPVAIWINGEWVDLSDTHVAELVEPG